MLLGIASDTAAMTAAEGTGNQGDEAGVSEINRYIEESLHYERVQLEALSCDRKNVSAFVADVFADLRPEGFVRRGRTLVIEGDQGQRGELRLRTGSWAPSPCALAIHVHLEQRIRPEDDTHLGTGWTFVVESEFRPRRPMTGLYDGPDDAVARFALIDPALPGQAELRAGVVQFGQQLAEALTDVDAYAPLLSTAFPSASTLTAAEYRRLRTLTQGGDLRVLKRGFRDVDARIPKDAWIRDSEGLRQILDAAENQEPRD